MYLDKRQLVEGDDGRLYRINGDGTLTRVDSFWWSPTGYIIKWSIVTFIFLFFFCYIVFGYMHAQRRMRKGLPPLAYHRFLISRAQRNRYSPQSHFTFYQNQQYQYGNNNNGPNGPPENGYYGMQNFSEPPPRYNGDLPPKYVAPENVHNAQYNPNGPPPPAGPPPQGQESGVVNEQNRQGGNNSGWRIPTLPLPPRAKTAVTDRFRWLKRN